MKSRSIIMTACFLALLPVGCNGGGSDGDADTDFSTEEIPALDMDVLETPTDVPVDISPDDLAADDPSSDPLPDPDAGEDAAEDPVDEDVAADVPP